jgi:hypothetical protein
MGTEIGRGQKQKEAIRVVRVVRVPVYLLA